MQLKPYSWWIFLSVALILSIMCFGAHHKIPHSLWSEISDNWLRSSPMAWHLNTTSNYTIVKSQYKGRTIREYDFTISEVITYVDGMARKVLGINGQYPGPLIEAFEGDTIKVRVTNKLKHQNTLLHFHGMHMNHTNYFDGSPGITQCGLQPGHVSVYEFEASPPGSYWYHGHWDTQMIKGLLGPLVIHEKNSSNAIDEESVLLLSDMYTADPQDLMTIFQEPWIGGNIEPIPDLALTQGLQNVEMRFTKGNVVKLRIVNTASYTVFRLELESGKMNVVEVDGTRIKPSLVSSLLIYPAQRYSIEMTIEKPDRLYTTPQLSLYEVNSEFAQFSTDNLELSSSNLSVQILVQETNVSTLPEPSVEQIFHKQLQLPFEALVEPYFQPLDFEQLPEATIVKNVDLSMTRSDEGAVSGAINDRVFKLDTSESLLMVLYRGMTDYEKKHKEAGHVLDGEAINKHHTHKEVDYHYNVIETSDKIKKKKRRVDAVHESLRLLPVDPLHISDDTEAVDFIIRNFDDGPHPMHLHGHKFWILERGGLEGNNFTTVYDRPLKRDVVWLPTDEWVRIRVVLDNPGLWFFHCHIPWHSKTGMATLIASQIDKLNFFFPPEEWFESCRVQKYEYTEIQNALSKAYGI